MNFIKENEVSQLLAQSNDPQVKAMASDVSVIKALVAVFIATLKFAPAIEQPGKLAEAGANKIVKTIGLGAATTKSKGLKNAEFIGSQALKTIGLRALSSASPAKAGITLSFTVADKIISAVGIADQNKISKCQLALSSLVTNTVLSGMSCAGTAGIGCAIGAIVVANEAFNTYYSCRIPDKKE